MFVLIGKLLTPLASPLGTSFVLWVAGALIYWRWSRAWGLRCAVAGIALVLLCSNFLVGEALLRSLEDDYPCREPAAYPRADAIVVLGGVTGPPIPPRTSVDVGAGFDRLLHGVRLLRADRAPLLVLSGGVISFMVGSEVTEALRLQELALEYGVAPEAMVLEERSRNTYENGLYTRELLQARGIERILLVTSALHMWRAAAVFRSQGLEVIPAPTDVRVVPRPFTPARLLPDLSALEFSTAATKEYVGFLVYCLKGWIS